MEPGDRLAGQELLLAALLLSKWSLRGNDMNQEMILKLAQDTLKITLMISGPLLLVSLVIGVIVSIAQVVTSIQDMTLSFVPRILAVFVAFLLLFPWAMSLMISYSSQLFGHLERFAR
jgi:flagellar biosynthesis protein FliQ